MEPLGRRELAAQAFVATLFLTSAGLLLALGPGGHIDAVDLVLLVVATAALGRLEFEVGSAFTVPTQLLFVPMLFVLPPAVVPLAVASALVLERLPAILAGRYHPQRVVMVLGDAWFSVGPALVFTLAHFGRSCCSRGSVNAHDAAQVARSCWHCAIATLVAGGCSNGTS